METILFSLPHTIFVNILCTTKTLGGNKDINYATLINKFLWEHTIYQVFNSELDKETTNDIMVRGSMIAKQQNFCVTNIKTMRPEINVSHIVVPQLDLDEIVRRRQ